MRCPYCGHKNPRGAKKCAVCGRRLDSVREKRKERRILFTGIVFIAVIIAAGVGAMFGVSRVLEGIRSADNQPQKVTIVNTPVPETVSSESVSGMSEEPDESVPAETPVPTAVPTPSQTVASLVGDDRKNQISALGYSKVTVSSATATSTISQEGIDNQPHVLYDGQTWTCWQDGVDGDGIGESVTLTFDRDYDVRFIVLRLGNWYSTDDYYYRNNRPSRLTFSLGGESFDVDFPDQKMEFTLEFSDDVKTSALKITIDAVYSGTTYQDTCINEVDVYGKPSAGSAAVSSGDELSAEQAGTQSSDQSSQTAQTSDQAGAAAQTSGQDDTQSSDEAGAASQSSDETGAAAQTSDQTGAAAADQGGT